MRGARHAEAVRAMAEYFDNCYVIDLQTFAPRYDEAFYEKFFMYGHMTTAGYMLTAKMIATYMDYIIRHNLRDFDLVPYIGREDMLEG